MDPTVSLWTTQPGQSLELQCPMYKTEIVLVTTGRCQETRAGNVPTKASNMPRPWPLSCFSLGMLYVFCKFSVPFSKVLTAGEGAYKRHNSMAGAKTHFTLLGTQRGGLFTLEAWGGFPAMLTE